MKFEEDMKKYEHDAAITYLGQLLRTREDIKEQLSKPKKDLKECMNYLMSCAKNKRSGSCAVMSDDEALSLAIHYYDEDDLKVEKVSGTVATSPKIKVQPKKQEQQTKAPSEEDINKLVSERVKEELNKIKEEEKKKKEEQKVKKQAAKAKKKTDDHADNLTIFDLMGA